jgi:hypothetical protein
MRSKFCRPMMSVSSHDIYSTKLVGWFMVFNATFNNISVISWRWVLLVEETGVPGENHRPAASHWQFLSYNVSSPPHHKRDAQVVVNPTPIPSRSRRPHARNMNMRFLIKEISFFVLMRFLCKTSHKESCAWPCLTWPCQPIKSPSIINGVRFYDCCSNINCRLSRSKKASNINFTWILTDFP